MMPLTFKLSDGQPTKPAQKADVSKPDMKPDKNGVYQIVEEMPKFPGGESALMEYVSKNVVYPEEAKEKEIQGRVFISFVVEKDGSIGEVKVLRGIGGGCDEEAARVISSMPKWKPGKQKGEFVRVSYQIPIMFKLGQTNDEYKTTVKTVIAGDGDYSYKASTATVPDNPAKASMKPDKDGVYQIVDEMPEFPGGVEALMDYVSRNVKYPESAKENNLQGRVLVKFVIEKDGSVSNVEVGRGWGNELDDEAVRVVKAMPKWKPGKQDGKPVRVSFILPINFKLGDGTPSKGPLMGTTWTGTATGKKGKVTYEMSWTINFTDGHDGMIMMTLWSKEKKGEKKVEFDDVPLPFEYTYDGKSTGSINPVNPDNSPMSETPIPPYGFVINPENTMRINVFDSKEDFGIGEIVVKKQK
jgi:TonB family protein